MSAAHPKADIAEAQRLAQAAHDAQEAKYATLAKDSDHAHETALANARDATAAYISSHRVRTQAVGDSRGVATSRAQGGGAQGSERSNSPPQLVAVQADDVNICTDNTLRLEAVRAWAAGMN